MSATLPEQGEKVPPLRHGDRMDYREFARRWDATPGLKKAELIDGRVYLMPPVSHVGHGRGDGLLVSWAVNYSVHTPGVEASPNATARLGRRQGPQPDTQVFVLPDHGGRVRYDRQGVVVGPPELVIETANTTARLDLGRKLSLYRRSGVREYIVYQPRQRTVQWFVFDTAPPAPPRELQPDMHSVVRSEVFPGLWLHLPGLFVGGPSLFDGLRQGLASPEHAAFVRRLEEQRAARAAGGAGASP